jgi:hypothetical protein
LHRRRLKAFFDFDFFTMGVTVGDEIKKPTGINLLLKECRRRFRIPENLDHYSEKDFKEAEKKFIKLCFFGGQLREQNK